MGEIELILAGVVGSTAYGLAHEDSDIDLLSVYQIPTSDMFHLNGPSKIDNSMVQADPDSTMHELYKFAKLCAACNPTVMELLWLPQWELRSDVGQQLIDIRSAFLSTRVRKTYGGYATQQMKRLKERGDGSFKSKLRKRKEKHARHLARLLIQGTKLLETGVMNVRLEPHEITLVREVSVLTDDELQIWFDKKIAIMDDTETVLPEEPDIDTINDFLSDARMRDLRMRDLMRNSGG